jgi:hypothetical protein
MFSRVAIGHHPNNHIREAIKIERHEVPQTA